MYEINLSHNYIIILLIRGVYPLKFMTRRFINNESKNIKSTFVEFCKAVINKSY